MKMVIDSFEVNGLHGQHTYSLRFVDNKLILIGENGAGKTTIVTMLYAMLTCQWPRLSSYTFKSVVLGINGERIEVTSELLTLALASQTDRTLH